MVKKTLLQIILLTVITLGCAAQQNTATVYFMRETGTIGAGAFSTFIDGLLVCHLNNNKFSIHTVAPGKHAFLLRADGKKVKKGLKPLELNMEAGQTYYISVGGTEHAFAASIYLTEVTVNTANRMLPKLKEDDCN